jgi:hypothetical protein
MLLEGVHLKQMGTRLGHADTQTTAKYAHLTRGLRGRARTDRAGGTRLRRGTGRGVARSCKSTCIGTGHQTTRSGTPERAAPIWRVWSGREDLNLRPPEPH